MGSPGEETTKSLSLPLSSATQPWKEKKKKERGWGEKKNQTLVFLDVSWLRTHRGAPDPSPERGGFKCLPRSTVAQLRSQALAPAAAEGPERPRLTCGSRSSGRFSARCRRFAKDAAGETNNLPPSPAADLYIQFPHPLLFLLLLLPRPPPPVWERERWRR